MFFGEVTFSLADWGRECTRRGALRSDADFPRSGTTLAVPWGRFVIFAFWGSRLALGSNNKNLSRKVAKDGKKDAKEDKGGVLGLTTRIWLGRWDGYGAGLWREIIFLFSG
jgi:hypothetical protein